MNKKTFIILCSLIGGIAGIAFGIYVTEPEKEQSPETKAALYEAMESSANSSAFVDDIAPEPEFENFSNYSDYNQLCSQNYGVVSTIVTREADGHIKLVLIGPKEEVDFIRMKVNIGANVHYCEELAY